MKNDQLLYQIALTLTPGIGPVKAKILVNYCGSAEAIFNEKPEILQTIPDIGPQAVQCIREADFRKRAEQEIRFMEAHDIRAIYFGDRDYPSRLKLCDDSPMLLFAKGKMNLNTHRVISVVGTRSCTDYGRIFCEKLLQEIAPYDPLIVSGMAYGIDICAHRQAVKLHLQTVGCVAHGLEKIYPAAHRPTASDMFFHGGLITEFVSQTEMLPELFPARNRLIAGMSDCTIVVETDSSGGSIITAYLAHSYGREVYALPGRHNDSESSGCNMLIRKNVAAILTSGKDLIEYLGWTDHTHGLHQLDLFPQLTEDEDIIVQVLRSKGKSPIDELSISSGMTIGKLSSQLLELEFKGVIRSLPGKQYDLVR